jgi:hypothetical protein
MKVHLENFLSFTLSFVLALLFSFFKKKEVPTKDKKVVLSQIPFPLENDRRLKAKTLTACLDFSKEWKW